MAGLYFQFTLQRIRIKHNSVGGTLITTEENHDCGIYNKYNFTN